MTTSDHGCVFLDFLHFPCGGKQLPLSLIGSFLCSMATNFSTCCTQSNELRLSSALQECCWASEFLPPTGSFLPPSLLPGKSGEVLTRRPSRPDRKGEKKSAQGARACALSGLARETVAMSW